MYIVTRRKLRMADKLELSYETWDDERELWEISHDLTARRDFHQEVMTLGYVPKNVCYSYEVFEVLEDGDINFNPVMKNEYDTFDYMNDCEDEECPDD